MATPPESNTTPAPDSLSVAAETPKCTQSCTDCWATKDCEEAYVQLARLHGVHDATMKALRRIGRALETGQTLEALRAWQDWKNEHLRF